MHKLCDFIYDELDDLEKKADKDKLTMDDIEYGDLLAHFLKSMKTVEAMDESEYSYGYGGSYYDGRSMARGRRNAKRDARGRYSRADAMDEMRDMAEEMYAMAPNEETRQRVQRFMSEMR